MRATARAQQAHDTRPQNGRQRRLDDAHGKADYGGAGCGLHFAEERREDAGGYGKAGYLGGGYSKWYTGTTGAG